MTVEAELNRVAPQKDMLLTIGVFDGVHLGHRYLIARLIEQARQQNLLSGIVTFRQHPLEVLSPETVLPYLTNLTEKVRLLKKEGVDEVIVLSFTRRLAGYSAHQFVGLLKKHLRLRGLVIGPDFVLGNNREGNADVLRQLGREMGFSVTVLPPVNAGGEVVSSTLIRAVLAAGDMNKVAGLIGRPFSLQGRVITGAGRGARLGFPTANIEIDPKQALPPDGIYVTLSYVDGKTCQSVTSIGLRPTFGNNERTVETYIIDYDGNLYGRELRIDIVRRLRDEKRFENVEDLKKQIAEDVKLARTLS
ncbi:MAG: bifunctional riboflavin kinase/FAD synthetase [Chloroflexota bacterium]